MSNGDILTKDQILNGGEITYEEHIEALGGKVALRQMTDGEMSSWQARRVKGQSVTQPANQSSEDGMLNVDLYASHNNIYSANCWLVAKALSHSGEKWTPEEVQGMPPGATAEIASKIRKRYRADEEEAAEAAQSFPDE